MARILLVTEVFPPEIGGPATFFDALGHELVKREHRVTVICFSRQRADGTDAQRPFCVRRIAGSTYVQQILARWVIAQEMPRHETVLLNGMEQATSQVAALLRRQYVLRIAGDYVWETARNQGLTKLSFDEFQTQTPSHPSLRRIAQRRARYLKQASFIVTPSQYLRRIIAGWGVEDQRIRVVLNGIRLNEFAAFQPTRRSTRDLHVAFVGRLTNWKGVDTLLHAVQGLSHIALSIIGDGPEMPMLRDLVHQLDLNQHAQFLGALSRRPMQYALAQAHVLVLGSLYEGLSHTLLEASAMGLACVASECGGNPEIIESGVNGVLFPYGDVEQLRATLERLRDDEDLRYRLASNAKRAVERFDFDETVRRTGEIILR